MTSKATASRTTLTRSLATVLLLAVPIILLGGGCGSAVEQSQSARVNVASFSGLVTLPDGRKIFAECSGSGSPTVIMIPGSRSWHAVWDSLPDPTTGELAPSQQSVYAQVARVTRVCTYDRPGTSPADGSPMSTLVTQPTTAQQGSDDLATWMAAAKIQGPYVLVAHSWGGMIAALYAGNHADQVAGLVFVDPATPNLQDALTPEQWETFIDQLAPLVDGSNAEVPDYPRSMESVQAAAGKLPDVPTVVITSDREFDFGAGAQSWPAWGEAQAQFAAQHKARHITHTDSSHLIPLQQPQLVADAVLEVVVQAR